MTAPARIGGSSFSTSDLVEALRANARLHERAATPRHLLDELLLPGQHSTTAALLAEAADRLHHHHDADAQAPVGFVLVGRQRGLHGPVAVAATVHTDPDNCRHTRTTRGGQLVPIAGLGFEINTRPCTYCTPYEDDTHA